MASSPALDTISTLNSAMRRDQRSKSHVSGSIRTSLEKQPAMYKDPSLRARVPRAVLEGGNVGPFRKNVLRRIVRRFVPKAAVKVEPLSAPGLSTSVLYASENVAVDADFPFAETMLTSGPPDGDLVYTDSAFEIRVAGMLVKNFDRWVPHAAADNELLMYSVQMDPDGNGSGDAAQSLPFIHFDHRSDRYTSIERPNTFVPIPASKAYVTGSSGKRRVFDDKGWSSGANQNPNLDPGKAAQVSSSFDGDVNEKRSAQEKSRRSAQEESMRSAGARKGGGRSMKSVNVQFKILELDTPNETVKQAISRIDELGGIINTFSTAAPALGILSPALSLAGSVSKQALDSYARPDKVISIDMDFLLADRRRVAAGTSPPGEYLRYGYYFFLSEPMEGKLYASVLTPKNVQLMLRRCDRDFNVPRRITGDPVQSRKFFPLTQVSYLVVRVCEPTSAAASRRRKPIQMAHARELDDIFSRAKSKEDPEQVKKAIKNLGKKLGVLESDSDSGSEDEDGM